MMIYLSWQKMAFSISFKVKLPNFFLIVCQGVIKSQCLIMIHCKCISMIHSDHWLTFCSNWDSWRQNSVELQLYSFFRRYGSLMLRIYYLECLHRPFLESKQHITGPYLTFSSLWEVGGVNNHHFALQSSIWRPFDNVWPLPEGRRGNVVTANF